MKNILTLLVLLHAASLILAQDNQMVQVTKNDKGFYLRGGLGYAITHAGQTYSPNGFIYSGTSANYNSTFNMDKVSFSSGLRAYVGLGCMFNKNIGVELNAESGIVNSKYRWASTQNIGPNLMSTDENVDQKAHLSFLINPCMILQTGGDKWNIYTRLGIALPVSQRIDIDEDVTETNSGAGGSKDYKYTLSLKTSFSIGFTGAAGLSYKISDKVKIWVEMSVLSLSLYAKELDYLSATLNGQDHYAYLSRTAIPYNLNGSQTANNNMTYAIPFSNVALNAGVKWDVPKFKIRIKKKHVTPREYNRH